MKKKLVTLALAASMAASALVGCGSSGSTTASEAPAADSTATAEATADNSELPVVTMEYLLIGDTSSADKIEAELNKILAEKAQAQVKLVGIEFANLTTQLNLMLAGGDNSIDLFNSFWYTSMSNLVANGQVIKLNDLLQSDGKDILKLYDGKDAYLGCGRVGEDQYGIPSIYAWSSQNEYIVQQADSDAAGIDWSKVTTFNDMTDAMLAMKKASPDKYFVPGSTQPYYVPKDIDCLGDTNNLGVLTDPTNSTTVENYYESDYFNNVLDQVQIWKENDLISPDGLSNSDPNLVNLQNGIADGTPGYNWSAEAGITSTEAQYVMDLTGGAITDPLATSGDVTTYMWHISSFCKDPAAAMRVLNVLYTDVEAAQLVGQGIKDENYVDNGDGTISYPEGKTLFDCGWGPNGSALWPNITLCTPYDYQGATMYEDMQKQNETAAKSLALGFVFDSTPVADQVAACTQVVAQYYTPLMLGEVSKDEALGEFNQALKDAGIDEIVAEKQRQLDDWLSQQ